MTDFPAELASLTPGQTMTERSGATAGTDTVPAGCVLLMRNTGAGTHVVTLTNNQTADGLTVSNRTHSLTTGQIRTCRVNPLWGDANGRVGIGVDGTAAELKYYILGGV